MAIKAFNIRNIWLLLAVVAVSVPVASLAVNNGDIPVNTAESARRMIKDLANDYGDEYTHAGELLAQLDEIEGQLRLNGRDQEAQTALQALIRRAALTNPLLDADKILVIRRKGEANRALNSHTSDTIPRSGWDNDIAELSELRNEVKVHSVYRHADQSIMKHMDLHFSGQQIMFSGVGKNGNWAILEVDSNGKNLREMTPDDQPDVQWFDGCYLPEDGQILACSTAMMQGLPCENGGKPMVNLYRIDRQTRQARQLTFEQDSDWHPRVMDDGRVMYLRWEYTDTPHYYSRILFQMNPDGTGQMEYWGSGSYFPAAFVWARPIPGKPGKAIGIVSGHHAKSETGRLLLIDRSLSRKYPFKYQPVDKIWGPEGSPINIHPEILPANETGCVQEIPGWGRDVVGNVYDGQGGGQRYTFGTPWPLSDKYFLVSMRGYPGTRHWALCLVDVFDNMTVVYEDPEYDVFEPILLTPRQEPLVLVDRTIEDAPATITCTDVYDGRGLDGIPRGTVKSLRVFSYHFGYVRSGGHESVGLESGWDIKRILGTVPVEADGSFSFEAPANTPLAIQPLDEDGAALAIMRSWMVAMPGETLSCNGCHEELNEVTPPRMSLAGQRRPQTIKSWYGPPRPFAFATEIQPMLDKYCLGCHHEQARRDDGLISFEQSRPDNWRGDQSYLNLVAFVRRWGPESDLDMYNALEWHASTSPLIQMLKKGHHGVKVEREMWERLYAWIDLNAPHRGMWNNATYEKKRLDLAKLYAGLLDNPEEEHRNAMAELKAQERVTPVMPPEVAKAAPDGLKAAEFPMDADSAKALQGGNKEMELQLAEGVTMRLANIPAGEFVMGSQDGYADESPRAVVKIAKSFGMGICEVTNKQYAAFDPMHDTRYLDEDGKDHAVPGHIANHEDQPVARISWQQADAYCKWLSEKSGKKVRLPTEAQWEWASRAGSDKQFFYGDGDTDFSKYANLADASRRRTYVKFDGGSRLHKPLNYPENYLYPLRDNRFTDRWFIVDFVRQYEPNAWGLYDMVGNVNEWTASDYEAYPYSEKNGRNAGRIETKKVARGGSWNDRPTTAGSSVRFPFESYQKVYNVGFRVVVEGASDEDFDKEPVAPVVAPMIDRSSLMHKAAGGLGHEPPEAAFDGDKRTKWYHNGVTTTWIQCKFTEKTKKAYSGYAITSGNDCPGRDPMDWRLEGSDEGKTWTMLDKRSDEKFSGRHQTKTFTVTAPKAFIYYRLSIDKSATPGDGIQLSEIEFLGAVNPISSFHFGNSKYEDFPAGTLGGSNNKFPTWCSGLVPKQAKVFRV